jgi:ubiquinone biosynthesis protein COQ9
MRSPPDASPGAARTGSGASPATTATDYNHYTKRTILIGVYGSTTLVFLGRRERGHGVHPAFLARRIDDVMRFEKAKARFTARYDPPAVAQPLSSVGLRYPAR